MDIMERIEELTDRNSSMNEEDNKAHALKAIALSIVYLADTIKELVNKNLEK